MLAAGHLLLRNRATDELVDVATVGELHELLERTLEDGSPELERIPADQAPDLDMRMVRTAADVLVSDRREAPERTPDSIATIDAAAQTPPLSVLQAHLEAELAAQAVAPAELERMTKLNATQAKAEIAAADGLSVLRFNELEAAREQPRATVQTAIAARAQKLIG